MLRSIEPEEELTEEHRRARDGGLGRDLVEHHESVRDGPARVVEASDGELMACHLREQKERLLRPLDGHDRRRERRRSNGSQGSDLTLERRDPLVHG